MVTKAEILKENRDKRSVEKRRAVEHAIGQLRESNQPITFKSVAHLASVSRQYLYNNFRDTISAERLVSREQSTIIDGISVPSRTIEEYRHTESVLRKKIDKQKTELTDARRKLATSNSQLERERGQCEHFRQLWIKSNTEN